MIREWLIHALGGLTKDDCCEDGYCFRKERPEYSEPVKYAPEYEYPHSRPMPDPVPLWGDKK